LDFKIKTTRVEAAFSPPSLGLENIVKQQSNAKALLAGKGREQVEHKIEICSVFLFLIHRCKRMSIDNSSIK